MYLIIIMGISLGPYAQTFENCCGAKLSLFLSFLSPPILPFSPIHPLDFFPFDPLPSLFLLIVTAVP